MIDDGPYSLDEMQQANAIIAGTREVELLVISDHLEVGNGIRHRIEKSGSSGVG